MNKLDEIKRRVARLEYFKKEVEDTPPIPERHETGVRQTILYNELRASEKSIESFSLHDIPYLLSIIKQAENEFNKIYSLANGLNPNEMIIHQKVAEALKSIQGEG